MPHIPLIFIIAGEPSGDQLGADLMASLKEVQDVRFAGIGGPAMANQGLTSLFPMEELSLMGVLGILKNLPSLLRRLSYTVQTIQHLKPDVVVTIDAQEFSFRIMKRVHKFPQRPRLIHYVAPTVWAYRSGRARKISKIVDRLLCLYPFEPPYFEKYGLKSIFVGHPVVKEKVCQKQSCFEIVKDPSPTLQAPTSFPSEERYNIGMNSSLLVEEVAQRMGEGYRNAQFAADFTIDKEHRDSNLLCVLPGSRNSEIKTLLPIFRQTVTLIQKEILSLKIIIPTLPSKKKLVEQETKTWPLDVQIVVGDEARQTAFQKAFVALAASGTVALQLSAAGLPFVITYKVDKINEWIGRAILKTPWVCMVNILLAFRTFGAGFVLNRKAKEKVKEPWIPEFLQEECTPENLKGALIKLFEDPEARSRQANAMNEAIALLKAPSPLAAQSILEESRE
jgi:lipid-A-disaccharide synthase